MLKRAIFIIFSLLQIAQSGYASELDNLHKGDHLVLSELNVNWDFDHAADSVEIFDKSTLSHDLYGELLRYYSNPIDLNRRAIDWRDRDVVFGDLLDSNIKLERTTPERRLRLYGSMAEYNFGASAQIASNISETQTLNAKIDLRSGRDLFVDGVYSTSAYGLVEWSQLFDSNADGASYVTASLYVPYSDRALRRLVNSEIIELTNNYGYNGAWGDYQGSERSSSQRGYALPRLNTRYQREWGERGEPRNSTLAVELEGCYGFTNYTSLGWYNAYNPYPDYYRNLPSYLSNDSSQLLVEEVWRTEDQSYTQINWDELVWSNEVAGDEGARYVMESDVSRIAEMRLGIIAESKPKQHIALRYGVEGRVDSSRNYMQLDDLLGGEYLLDLDQYIGDYEHLNTSMRNNLRGGSLEIYEGDRFGYDYTLSAYDLIAHLGVSISLGATHFEVNSQFGERVLWRTGHFERERFEGDLSYGSSKSVSLSMGRHELLIAHKINEQHQLKFEALYAQTPPESKYLFVQPEYCNQWVVNPTSERLYNTTLNYQYRGERLRFEATCFYYRQSDGSTIQRYYDDLSYTFSDAHISQIESYGLGLELAAEVSLSRDLKLDATLSIGDYRYCDAPQVALYDDVELSLFSESRASAIEGCAVGGSAQIYSTVDLDYFVKRGWILSTRIAYAGGRYVDPSFLRRTDRVLGMLYESDLREEAISQESLPDMIDMSISAVRTIFMRGGRSMSFVCRIDNLLGVNDLVDYGRESHRILSSSGDTRYLQPNYYSYASPRRLYLSISYSF